MGLAELFSRHRVEDTGTDVCVIIGGIGKVKLGPTYFQMLIDAGLDPASNTIELNRQEGETSQLHQWWGCCNRRDLQLSMSDMVGNNGCRISLTVRKQDQGDCRVLQGVYLPQSGIIECYPYDVLGDGGKGQGPFTRFVVAFIASGGLRS